jgi:aryl-alcohol dehydrogenase-like predicted oxidoreductase
MEQRRLGKTRHMSSILTFGGAALWLVTQAEAEAGIAMAVKHGINHFDVAPQYGQAEMRLGPWLEKHRREVFLACKTMKRSKKEVRESIQQSLKTMRVDDFDLFQLHGVDDMETLQGMLGPNGGMEAIIEAKKQGLLRYIGITGHKPSFLADALQVFDFDTVLFPLNRIVAAHPGETIEFSTLLKVARQQDVGTIAMKTVAMGHWNRNMHMYKTWYEPFDTQEDIDKSLWYALSQDITTVAMPGDLRLWPMVIDAAERFKPMTKKEQSAAVIDAKQYKPLFPPD